MHSTTGDKINRAVKVIVGLLLMILGCMFLAMPVVTLYFAITAAGIILVIAGAVELLSCMFSNCRRSGRPSSMVSAIFKVFLGVLLLVLDKGIVVFLPIIVSIWLAVIGVWEIVRGIRRKRDKDGYWANPVALGVIAIMGAIAMAIFNWLTAYDMLGVLCAVIAILYGFVILTDAFVKTAKRSAGELKAEDANIAGQENATFREFEKKLKDE